MGSDENPSTSNQILDENSNNDVTNPLKRATHASTSKLTISIEQLKHVEFNSADDVR